MPVTAYINFAPTQEAIRALGRRGPIAMARALNRTATSERAAMASAIAKDMGLKVGTIRDALVIGQASAARLESSITVRGKKLGLIEFGAKQTRRGGVTAKLPLGAGHYPNAFIATMSSGHRGVFERVPGGARRGPKPMRSQLPIFELCGPSIGFVFQKYIPLGAARRDDVLLKNLQHEWDFALSKAS